jgi:hypothetical protein
LTHDSIHPVEAGPMICGSTIDTFQMPMSLPAEALSGKTSSASAQSTD